MHANSTADACESNSRSLSTEWRSSDGRRVQSWDPCVKMAGVSTDRTQGRLRPHPDVLVQVLPEGEAVLLHMGSEVYFGLDPIGARMWEALADTGDIEATASQLANEFEVEEDRLLSDLRQLVAELTDAQLLEIAET